MVTRYATDYCREEGGNAIIDGIDRARIFSRTGSVRIAYYSLFSATDFNGLAYQLLDRPCSASFEYGQALKRG